MGFSGNKQISGRQLSRMILLDLITVSCMVIPGVIIEACGRQGLFSIVIGFMGAAAYGFLLFYIMNTSEKSFYDLLRRYFGKKISVVIMICFFRKFLCLAVFFLKMLVDVINKTFLTEIPEKIVAALVLLVSYYAVTKGIEARGRLSELLTWLIILPILVILILSLHEIRADRIVPVQVTDSGEIFKGGIFYMTLFGALEFILFALPCVQKRQIKIKNILWPVSIASGFALLISIACIGVLSVRGAAREPWPSVILMQIIRLPGFFISRQDGLLLALWMPGALILLSGYLFYSDTILRQVSGRRYRKWFMVIGLILVYGAFCLTGSYENLQKIYLRFGFVFGIVPTILILLWILFRSKTVHFSKKACLFLLIPLSALMLNGCVGSVQMEDRNDVMAMGIDYDHVQKKLIVSMSFPDVAALTGEGEYLSFPAVSLTADNLQAAKEQFHRESNKRLDYGQIQAIVLGQSVLESRAVLESVLTYMKQHQEFTRTTYICAAKGHACDIIALDESVNGSIGIYLKELFENNWTADHHETAILNDVLVCMENPRESIELVIVDNQGELPYICGKTEMKF